MKAVEIAYYLIALAREKGFSITNLKLQKMLYFIQREEIRNGRVAFEDRIEAWQYRPVIPNVYYRFAGYGPISIVLDINSRDIIMQEDTKISVDKIFEEYIGQNVWNMVDETHIKGNAWVIAFDRGYKSEIRVDDIRREIGALNNVGWW